MLRTLIIALVAGVLTTSGFCLAAEPGGKKILFFSPSLGFRHSVVARPTTGELSHAEKVLKEFAGAAGYQVDVSQDCKDLENDGAFKKYDVIIFYTTGNPLISREAFLKWLRAGGAFVGIHTATDSFHHPMNAEVPIRGAEKAKLSIPDWPEYVHIVGGAFKTHGQQQEVAIKVEDAGNPATKMIPADWRITDEIYQFDRFSRDNVHVLLSIDTDKISDASLDKLKMEKGKDYPVAWTRAEGKGRIFYTSLGHREDVWTNPVYQQHVLGGIAWALGQDADK